ncbi:WD40 repeat domain-containing protein [Natronorubrum sp. DTA28]|uniref:WD40 repeat domain-containing protein n=1 Tax=Natronorubrum sp. DTA28 TaxID=3447019 RepID=UPI003F833E9E
MSADDSPQPTPTAHDIFPGCSLDRRTFLQGTGASAAAIAAGGMASSTAATVDNPTPYGIVAGVKSAISGAASASGAEYAVASMGVGGFVAVASYQALRSSINESPSSDPVILHNICRSEVESLAAHEVNFNNRLNDARPVANLEARHGIALSWEDGENALTGYDISLQRIRQHYETPEFNHVHTTNKSALQYSYVAGAAEELVEDGGEMEGFDAYFTALASDPENDDESYQLQLTNDRTEAAYELHDGTSIEDVSEDELEDVLGDEYESAALETPVVEIFEIGEEGEVDSDDPIGSFPMISGEIVDTWDDEEEVVTVETDDGTELEWDYRFTSAGFHEDEESEEDVDSAPMGVFDGREFCKILQRIWDDSDTVTANYSQSFVEDIYAELDAGNITPEQVRSPEGMVHFLSGTDDPTNERFQVAMMQQFGMEQPDFSMVSGMEVTWSGATDTAVDVDPDLDDRHVYPDGFVDDEQYEGVVFGDALPEEGFQSGEKYVIGPPLYGFDQGGNLYAVNQNDGSLLWEKEVYDDTGRAAAISRDGDSIFIGGDEDTTVSLDASDGSVNWTYDDHSDRVGSLAISHDGDTLYAVDSADDIHAIDADSGSSNWTESPVSGSPNDLAASPTDDLLLTVGNFDDIVAIDTTDGSTEWTVDNGGYAEVVGFTPDGQTAFAADDGTLMALDPETGDEQWSFGDFSFSPDALTASNDVVAFGEWGGEIVGVDTESGEELWSDDDFPRVTGLSTAPGGRTMYLASDDDLMAAFDPEDGTIEWTFDAPINAVQDVPIFDPGEQVDGMASRAMIFDDGQVDLWNGVLEVHEMYDADGATITHVDDETIDDLEEATGEDIDTILEEVDGYDDESDIQYTRDVMNILEHYGAEDELENIHRNETDYESPEYDTFDSEDFAAFLNELEDYQDSLEEEDDETNVSVGIDNPLDDFGDGAVWVGLAVIVMVILTVVSIVTDAIPILNN